MPRLASAVLAATLSTIALGTSALPAFATTSTTGAGATATSATADAGATVYIVKNGDYLKGIATKLGVPLPALLATNKITVTAVIHPGDTLIVPVGGTLPAEVTAAVAPAAPATPAEPAPTYVVKNGDFLSRIASRMGVKLSALLTANSMTIASVIHPGDAMVVPAGGTLPVDVVAPPAVATAPPASAPTSAYVVQSGDYLFGIAARNGVTVKALLAANKMTIDSAIHPGVTLSMPAATLPIPVPVVTPTVIPVPGGQPGDQPASTPASISTVLAFLQSQLGKPYAFNTAGPDTYDCSGLVTAAYLTIGIALPHQSLLQSKKGTAVDFVNEPILAGDLVFQYSTSKPTEISHVGIAISDTQWVQAARTGDVVKISPMPKDSKIVAVRRIVQP